MQVRVLPEEPNPLLLDTFCLQLKGNPRYLALRAVNILKCMNSNFHCPYCQQPKDGHEHAEFTRCSFCGFHSALVDSISGLLLIVDRRMPFLKKRVQELKEQMPHVTVIVDRRIAQDPFGKNERRMILGESQAV